MKPGEHKTVQARIIGHAEAIGWTFVSREEAEQRRGFDPAVPSADRALLGQIRHHHTDIYGNREFVEHLRNRGKFFDHEEKRERDLILIEAEIDWKIVTVYFGRRPVLGLCRQWRSDANMAAVFQ